MYMNGRGPMMGGHRGPMMGAPMHHHRHMGGPGMGFGPGFRPMYRPMRMYHHRPMGFFPLGGLFILPALMFGGWIVVAVLGGILGLVGSIIGGVFEGLGSLASGAFTGSGLVIGIVIGLALYFWLKKRNTVKEEETTSTADGEAVEAEIVEPQYRQMNY